MGRVLRAGCFSEQINYGTYDCCRLRRQWYNTTTQDCTDPVQENVTRYYIEQIKSYWDLPCTATPTPAPAPSPGFGEPTCTEMLVPVLHAGQRVLRAGCFSEQINYTTSDCCRLRWQWYNTTTQDCTDPVQE